MKGATFHHDLTLPLPPPGFLHTPDGGHPAPTPSRPSPAVFSAPWAGHWGGSAYPPGTHSHSAGKATMTYPKKDMHMQTPSTTNNAISLLPGSPFFFFHFFFVLFASVPLPLCHTLYGAHLCFTHRISASFLFTCGFVTFHNYGRLMQIFVGKSNVFCVCVLASHFILLLYFINPPPQCKIDQIYTAFLLIRTCSPHTIHTVSFPSLSP